MGQPVIVVPGATPDPADTSAAFAAGVAAATSAQAEETAEAAAAVAAEAAALAETARERATDADIEASTAQAGVQDLVGRLNRLEGIVDDLSDVVVGDGAPGEPVDPTLPPRVTVEVEPVAAEEHTEPEHKPEPKSRGFGSNRWFGSSR